MKNDISTSYKIFILFLFSYFIKESYAQLDTIHWLPPLYPSSANVNDQYLYLSTPSVIPFTVVVKDGAGTVLATPLIAKGTPYIYNIGGEMTVGINALNNVQNSKGITVEGVSKFYANYRVKIPSQSGSLTAKGRSGKGRQFRIGLMPVQYNNGSRNNFFSIMATEDNTVVTVSDYDAGVVFNGAPTLSSPTLNFTLNKGETYTASCKFDVAANMTGVIGALVSSDKDIVVNVGNFLGALELAAGGQDIGIDQIVPVDVIGSEYISIKGEGLPSMEQVLVVAHENNTEVFVNGSITSHSILNAGDWALIDASYYQGVGHQNMYIETSKPVYCFQFIGGSPSTATQGMNLLAPLSCKLPYAINEMSDVDKIGTQNFTGGVFIVTRAGANITINGAAQGGVETVLGNPNWETYKVSGLVGNVSINSDQNLIGGIFGVNGAAGWAGYFSGFDTDPIKVALASVDSCGSVELTTDTTYLTYSWFNNNVSYPGSSDTNIVNHSGDYKVIMTRPDGCKDSAFIDDVVVYNDPVALFSVADDCVSENAVFVNSSTVTNDSIVSYMWSFGDVLPVTQVQSVVEQAEYEYFQAGTYDVRLVVETENGCRDTVFDVTERFSVPVVNFYASNECLYDSVNINNTSIINPPGVLTNIVWDYGDGSPNSNNYQENHKYTSEGDYQISLTAVSSEGCVSTTSETVSVYAVPISNFQSSVVCDNEGETVLQNLSNVSSGAIMISNWNFGDASNGNNTNPSHKYNAPGVYQVELVSVTNDGCVDTIGLPVTVKASPVAAFSLNKLGGCSPLCVNFSDQSQINSTSVVSQEWFFDEERLFLGASFSNCFENESTEFDRAIDVKYIVTNDVGCEDTLNIDNYLTVYHNPVSLFQITPEITNMYEREVDMENNSIGADNYLWFLASDEVSEDFEPAFEYPDTGNYEVLLIAYTDNNCVDSSYRSLIIEPVESIYIPNAFSPNGDGANDVFNVSTFGLSKEGFYIRVFNRWGEIVFESDDLFKGWDGLSGGDVCSSGVYVYKVVYLTLKDEVQEQTGTVTLIK